MLTNYPVTYFDLYAIKRLESQPIASLADDGDDGKPTPMSRLKIWLHGDSDDSPYVFNCVGWY